MAGPTYMDTFDGVIGWPLGPGREHPPTDLFLADHLVLDDSLPYAVDGLLEIGPCSRPAATAVAAAGRSTTT